jgi:hypothetical protein
MKVNLAAEVIRHIAAASLSTVVATGKDQWPVRNELYSIVKEVAKENNEG